MAPPELQVPGTTIYIKGRIDRVDFNERTGEWAVLDYKSSDSGKTPRSQHQASGKWVDLQLPLYRHLAREFGAPPDAKLGYIRLPKDPSSVGESFADWTLEELAEADRTAYEVIQAIVECRFWPPATRQQFEDEFSSICQDNIFARQLARDIEELMHRT